MSSAKLSKTTVHIKIDLLEGTHRIQQPYAKGLTAAQVLTQLLASNDGLTQVIYAQAQNNPELEATVFVPNKGSTVFNAQQLLRLTQGQEL